MIDYSKKIGIQLQTRKNDERKSWTATIGNSKYKNKETKNFSVKKYGMINALKMAFYQRLIFEAERDKKAKDYEFYCFELMKKITEFYNYEIRIENEIILVEDGITVFKYESAEEFLIDWNETLEESDKCSIEEKVPTYWEEERKFIRVLINIRKRKE